MSPADESSSDTGPMSRDGEMSVTSEPRPWYGHGSRKDYDEAVRMYEAGASVGKVAAHFGVSRQSMWKSLRRRTTLRTRTEAAALTRKPPTAVRLKRGKTRDRYRQRAARITVRQMREIRARDVVCCECQGEGTDFDHILPVALGGQTTLANLQLLCHPCHVEKSRADRTAAAAQRRGVA